MSRHKPHLDPATGAPRHPLPDTFADIVDGPRDEFGQTASEVYSPEIVGHTISDIEWEIQPGTPNDGFECYYLLRDGIIVAKICGPQTEQQTRHLNALVIAANSSAQPQTPLWQPIETAPKDGTTVILADDSDPMMAVIGFWQSGDWLVDWDHERFNDPTRWMPIPAYSLSRPQRASDPAPDASIPAQRPRE